ncbi:MAG TPA: hypothetical protein PLN06_01325 [Bacteroidales bacterium]|nr:hypothetical protein [Bacteroidales bacterium]HOU95253.1 hypothetical protein [Bacteroidales bacterium]HQG51899.1 hypothetical protein [Bacteroidales bacterium]HQJ19594.1 hypothetical protein [Bacteroidales bacterium]HRC90148.1 hypothetical protein [Bacteroidales bacterium]
MNKFYRAGKELLTIVLIFALFLPGCGRGGEKQKKEVPQVVQKDKDVERIQEEIKQAEKIFNALPTPLESAMLIKNAGATFDRKYLNPIENVKLYTTTRSMALNLGVYTCDLSFASLYDQTQLIIDYMNAAKKMADGLGILDAINEETITKLENNINNKEAIMEIISETFLNTNSYLADNNQSAIATIVLVGGWIEGLYISTQLVNLKDFDGNRLVAIIIDQKLSIDILINLLESHKGNPIIDELIGQMLKLKSVFDKINIQTTPIKTEIDQTTNVTILKSKVTTDMSLNTFKELTAVVKEIRDSFVK